ncbi:hypothetical protein PSP20601_01564 [Pandoraea sputorum]|uniref:Uncharacterized protein n=1 Tax=Pandoraea sputorum TaxID=93222 RepID=A0A239SFR1_9BURK|nr:Uncharacterised protein [Pandoraea sputorum]VVD89935.1 hypothetical protein PSP20601_01564 [Pandoraea sputorum]
MNVVPAESKNGSYGADLKFTSSAPICSKVDFYVDGTPYFTILSQGNQGEDRVFGQKAIVRSTISSVSCRVCKRAEGAAAASRSDNDSANKVPTSQLDGTWCSRDAYGRNAMLISGASIRFAFVGDSGSSGNTGTIYRLNDTDFAIALANGYRGLYRMRGKDHCSWIERDGAPAPQSGGEVCWMTLAT